MIKQEGSLWVVRSESGKSLGKYSSKKAAIARLRAVEFFKHSHRLKKQ